MRRDAVLDLAAAIADGVPVDWDAAAARAEGEEERRLIRQLRVVAEIAQALRAGQHS